MLQLLIRKMGGLVPILGQANHFVMYNKEKSPYGEEPYVDLTTDTNVKEWHGRIANRPSLIKDYLFPHVVNGVPLS